MKRFLAILLAVAMMAGMLSVQALAVEDGIPVQEVIPIETPQTPDATNSAPESGINEDTDPDATQVEKTWGSDYDAATEFTISTEAELRAFAKMANEGKNFAGKTVKLTEDIVLGDEQWIPIAGKSKTVFAGTFDGQLCTISGLKIELTAEQTEILYPGLFGTVSGTIKNVVLEDISISSPKSTGGIASKLNSGTIESCSVNGSITVTANKHGKFSGNVGGIVGIASTSGKVGPTIRNCRSDVTISTQGACAGGIAGKVSDTGIIDSFNYGSVEGRDRLGGIVGDLDGTVSGCENNGTVTSNATADESSNDGIGGIAGYATVEAEVSDCINNGAVTAENCNRVGGIVGYLYAGSDVTNCKNTASVTGNEGVGGVVGYATADDGATSNYNYGYSIVGCANSGPVSGMENVGGVVGIAMGVASQKESMEGLDLEVSNCTNGAAVSGTTNVGGIVGSNNAVFNPATEKYGIKTATEVSGCINTGSVPEGAGVIVGNNNDQGAVSTDKKAGIVQNNFWPAELGANAVGSGAGSSGSESAEAVKNNSSYRPDGTLTTPVAGSDGTEIENLGDAIDKVIGGGESGSENIPDAMKVTVTYKNGGHGTAPTNGKVTMGKSIILPNMNDDGYYTFTGWSDGTKTYEAEAIVTVMEDITFTAQWRDDTPSSSGSTKYTVSVEDADNGTIKVSPTRASKGSTVTINVTPDEGYELDKLVVTDKNGDTVKLTDKGSGTYTFKMPASKVTVEATFTQIATEPETLPFTDVKTGDWFYEAVQYVYDKGMMTGVSANRFAPASTTTRGMIVTILSRLENEPAVSGDLPFTDVERGAWYANAVAWAAANDIVNGTSATTFAPNSPITREQMATMLYRFAQYKGMDAVTLQENLTGYPDGGQVSDYAIPAMNWAIGQGLIAGMENGTLVPQGSATRAQVATILMRFCESIG